MNSYKCEYCGSGNIQSRGQNTYCKDCKRYKSKTRTRRQTFTENRKNNTAEVSAEVSRIMSDDDLLDFLKVDRSLWTITKVVYSKSEGYRKDRKVEWDVKDGKVTHGMVRDSGKLLIKPLFRVKVYLEKKINEIAA